jgi:ubiquitin carboxyl-terminal hydrolase 8
MLTLPKDTIIPKDLHNFLTGAPKYPRIQILLLDVRTREEFDREHIRVKGESSTATTTVCLEPSVLLRDS